MIDFKEISEKAKTLFFYTEGGDEEDWRALDEEDRSFYRRKYVREFLEQKED